MFLARRMGLPGFTNRSETAGRGWGRSGCWETGGSYCFQLEKQTQDLGLLPTKELIGADEIGVNGPSKDS